MYKRNRQTFEDEEDTPYKFKGVALPKEIAGEVDRDVPVWKQEVLDEKGRKRLHGAFTGGFSAGYFNSVGSKEGWTPSSFKSSRSNRAAATQLRPQDFMDEEDFEEGGEEETMELSENFTGQGMAEAIITLGKKKVDVGAPYVEELSIKEPEVFRSTSITTDEPATKKLVAKTTTKKTYLKGGIGHGVLNDDGEDDEDIYEIKPKTAYDRVLGGDKKKKKKVEAASQTGTAPFKKVLANHVFVSKKDVTRVGSQKQESEEQPNGLKDSLMNHSEVEVQSKEEMDIDTESPQIMIDTTKEPDVKPSIKTEEKPKKSVFDFMSAAARDRIASATGKTDLPPALGEVGPHGYISTRNPEEFVPRLEKSAATNALLNGFLPYADDPDKRTRYRTFLEIKSEARTGLPIRKPGMSLEDWAKEMEEFAHAAIIFKPMNGMMANRFTNSSSSKSSTNNDTSLGGNEETLLSRPADLKKEDPALTAAKMSMFGPLTRSVSQFMPSRLLCKRFNVRPPAHADPDNDNNNDDAGHSSMSSSTGGQFGQVSKKDLDLVSQKDMADMMNEMKTSEKEEEEERRKIFERAAKAKADRLREQQEKEKEVHAPEPELKKTEPTKPGQEVFRAIFGDGSEDDE